MGLDVEQISVGDEIEYAQDAGRNKIKVKRGIVVQITNRLISIQGERYPDSFSINDLVSDQVTITKNLSRGVVALVDEASVGKSISKEKLKEAFDRNKQKIDPTANELGITWHAAKKILKGYELIDDNNKPTYELEQAQQQPDPGTEKATNQEPDQEKQAAPEPVQDILPDPKLSSVIIPPPEIYNGQKCVGCGSKIVNVKGPYCVECFEKEHCETQPDPGHLMEPVKQVFNQYDFQLELIKAAIQVADEHKAPSVITLGVVYGICEIGVV